MARRLTRLLLGVPATACALAAAPPVPVVTVCDVLREPARWHHRVAIVVGALHDAPEGSWLNENCDGHAWTNALSLAYQPRDFAPPPRLPRDFVWDKVAIAQRLAQVKQTTRLLPKGEWLAIYGRLETKPRRARHATPGFGPRHESPAQLVAPDDGYLNSGEN